MKLNKSRIGQRLLAIVVSTMFLIFTVNQNNIIYAVEEGEDDYENDVFVVEDSVEPLYNENNEIVAYYFELNNGGYIIVNSEGSEFIEYSFDDFELDIENSKDYYYSGVSSIYEKVNNSIVEDCISGEINNIEDIDFSIKKSGNENEKSATELAIGLLEDLNEGVVEERNLKYDTMAYDYNPDGRCGAVAGAIVLRYYNDYVSTVYVKTKNETNDGKRLINLLVDDYLGKGTTYKELKSGLNKYLYDLGIRYRFQMIQGKNSLEVFNKIREYVKKNKPLIVGLTGNTEYGEHWVVGTGYKIIYNEGLGFFNIVNINDGWGNRNVSINAYYVDGCHYIYK